MRRCTLAEQKLDTDILILQDSYLAPENKDICQK